MFLPVIISKTSILDDKKISPLRSPTLKGLLIQSFVLLILILYLFSIYEFSLFAISIFSFARRPLSFECAWILIDLAFFVVVEIGFRGPETTNHLPISDSTVLALVLRELDDKRSISDLPKFLQGWFFETPLDALKRGDVRSWTAGFFHNKTIAALTDDQVVSVEQLVSKIEEKLDHVFPKGFGSATKSVRLTIDKVRVFHRPLVFYMAIKAIDFVGRGQLWGLGFSRISEKGMVTYSRSGDPNLLPIVFFHGIGIGLAPYVRFVNALVVQFPTRRIVCFEMMAIAMRLSTSPLLPNEYIHKVYRRLQGLNMTSIVGIGHSLGTICLRWLDFYFPTMLYSRIFLDPVCFSLWTSDVARNFMYRTPRELRHYLLHFVASLEPGIAVYLRRYFVWHLNTYFSHQLPHKSKIFLSEMDDIVNTEYVASYLGRYQNSEEEREVEILRGVRHGETLMYGPLESILADIALLSS